MLGNTFRSARLTKGLTQAALAKLANVSRKHISSIELGRVENVSVTTIAKLARILDVSDVDLGGVTAKLSMAASVDVSAAQVITARLVTDVQLLQEILTQPLAYQDVVQQLVATVTSLSADRREKFFDELGLLMSGASAPATREEVNETHVENRSSRRVRGDHK